MHDLVGYRDKPGRQSIGMSLSIRKMIIITMKKVENSDITRTTFIMSFVGDCV